MADQRAAEQQLTLLPETVEHARAENAHSSQGKAGLVACQAKK